MAVAVEGTYIVWAVPVQGIKAVVRAAYCACAREAAAMVGAVQAARVKGRLCCGNGLRAVPSGGRPYLWWVQCRLLLWGGKQ